MTGTDRMTDYRNQSGDELEESLDVEAGARHPRVPSDTVGTGSYVAVTCSVLAVLATLVLIAGLLISRWIT